MLIISFLVTNVLYVCLLCTKWLTKRISAKVDSASAAEHCSTKMSGVTSSAAPTGGQKLSMLAAKSGFVIPKNKLSGSLVPIYRGSRIQGATGATNVESSKQMHRKTKWGPDLTQDAAVKKGRALALQVFLANLSVSLIYVSTFHYHFLEYILVIVGEFC